MKIKNKGLLRRVKDSYKYWAEIFKLEFIEDITALMEKQGISQKGLAEKMGNSEAYISKVLNGYENLSINSISKMALALNAAPRIHVAPKDKIVEWKERDSYESQTEFVVETDRNITDDHIYLIDIRCKGQETNYQFPAAFQHHTETPNDWHVRPSIH